MRYDRLRLHLNFVHTHKRTHAHTHIPPVCTASVLGVRTFVTYPSARNGSLARSRLFDSAYAVLKLRTKCLPVLGPAAVGRQVSSWLGSPLAWLAGMRTYTHPMPFVGSIGVSVVVVVCGVCTCWRSRRHVIPTRCSIQYRQCVDFTDRCCRRRLADDGGAWAGLGFAFS